MKCGRTSVNRDLLPYKSSPLNNEGHLQEKHLKPDSSFHPELDPARYNASPATSTYRDTNSAFIRCWNLYIYPSLQLYFLSALHDTTYWFSSFSLWHVGKRLPIQNPKSFLVRWFLHLKSPSLNTSISLPLSNPSTKPLILQFHVVICTSSSSSFSSYDPVSWISLFFYVGSCSPTVPSYYLDGVVIFGTHIIPF